MTPMVIFGIKSDRFKELLQNAALQFDKYIRTTFVADLDNVQLSRDYNALDITDLINTVRGHSHDEIQQLYRA